MFCPKCGKPITSETKFCSFCGQNTQNIQTQKQSQQRHTSAEHQPPNMQSPPMQAPTNNQKMVIIVSIIAAIVIVGGIEWIAKDAIADKMRSAGIAVSLADKISPPKTLSENPTADTNNSDRSKIKSSSNHPLMKPELGETHVKERNYDHPYVKSFLSLKTPQGLKFSEVLNIALGSDWKCYMESNQSLVVEGGLILYKGGPWNVKISFTPMDEGRSFDPTEYEYTDTGKKMGKGNARKTWAEITRDAAKRK